MRGDDKRTRKGGGGTHVAHDDRLKAAVALDERRLNRLELRVEAERGQEGRREDARGLRADARRRKR